jgi:hypothetical protein
MSSYAIYCKVAMCMVRLVDLQAQHSVLIFEQKDGTSLVKLVLSRIKSRLRQSVCLSQLYN